MGAPCPCLGEKCKLTVDDPRHDKTTGYRNGCRCSACQKAQAVQRKHYRERNAEKERAQQRHRRKERPDEARHRDATYRRRYAAARKASASRYYQAHAEERRAYTANYVAANYEEVRRRESARRRTPEGREISRAQGRRRRERERSRYCGCDTRENLHAVWLLDGGFCAYCGAEGADYEHVVPLARGGWGCVSNFRVACKSCNSKKGTRPLSVFLARLAASGVEVRPGATNSGLPCPAAAERMSRRMLTA